MNFTAQELMVVAAAREIKDGEVVFAGMRLPLLAFALAKQTHAPHAIGLFENGLVRDAPAEGLLYTMGDPPNIVDALWATRMVNIMGLLAQGTVDVGFIGGAEIDRFGNLNTSLTPLPPSPQRKSTVQERGEESENKGHAQERGDRGVRLPGSGGAADIASLAKRLIVIMPHEKRRLVERVHYITSPGYGDGKGWRERVGLPRGGPSVLITTRAVFRFDPDTCRAVLHSFHSGETVETIRADTGWELVVSRDVSETPAPTEEELSVIRRYDPQGFWTGRREKST